MDNKVSNKHTKFTEAEIADLKQTFDKNDKNKDGRIDTEELLKLTATMGETASEEEIKFVIKSFDTDGDGSLDLEEFMSLMANLRAMGRD